LTISASVWEIVFVKKYPSDLTDSQWNHIKDFFAAPKETGRPRSVDFREIVNAILYLIFTGCQWRFIPNDYPKWRTVYGYFAAWQKDGTWCATARAHCARSCAARKANTNIRRLARLIPKASKPRPRRRAEDLTRARKFRVANDTSLLTRSV